MDEYLPLHVGVVAIEKGVLGSPSTKFANFITSCPILTIRKRTFFFP